MKILITGAQGQVGKELVSIAKQHYDVISAGRDELDITQEKNVTEYIESSQPDIVINAAAYTAVDKAEEDQEMAYAINRDGAKNLASACAQHNIPLLHISTDYVFNGEKTGAYSETDDVSPLGIYGDSKWQGEEAIREHLSQHIILRVAWVFGAQGNNFVKTMLRLAKDRDELNVVADQFGGPSAAKDIAKTLIQLVDIYQKEKILQWDTYHYCGTGKTNWCDFAKEIFRLSNVNGLINKDIRVNAITTAEYPTLAKRPQNSMLNCEKIKNTFGIDMPDWHDGLNEVLTELQ